MTLVKVRRAAQITLPRDIREAARLEEGDYLEAELTESGTILLKPVNIAGREPTPKQEAEILAAVAEHAIVGALLRRSGHVEGLGARELDDVEQAARSHGTHRRRFGLGRAFHDEPGSGLSGAEDRVRRTLDNEEGPRVNPFFRELYRAVAATLAGLRAKEHTAQVHTEVEGLGECVALLGVMLRGDQCLLQGRHRFPIGRAPLGLAPRLPAVEEGLVPDLAL